MKNSKILIQYKTNDGQITVREISQIVMQPYSVIDAYCHLREGRRTFNLHNIQSVELVEAGDDIDDINELLTIWKSDYKVIFKEILPAIMALKYFCLQVRRKRGFDEKERRKILVFIKMQLKLKEEDLPPIETWLRGLCVGDIFDPDDPTYMDSLKQIPADILPDVKTCAYDIAAGSSRTLMDDVLIRRIESEFCINPERL